jgi:histidyl-tRNA synthetase
MGDVVLLELLKDTQLLPKFDALIDVFCLIEDESLRPDTLGLISRLREAGCIVDYALTAMKPDKQFKRAMEQGAAHTVKIERDANGSRTVRVRNLATRADQAAPFDEALPLILAASRASAR